MSLSLAGLSLAGLSLVGLSLVGLCPGRILTGEPLQVLAMDPREASLQG